jgi:aspartyl-tRNA(Asn)/glutamyl-tRNA(Gln) amidotransferase subunit C
MSLSRDDVVHVAQLARIALTDDEIETYRSQLSSILENFAVLSEVDTDAIAPTAQVISLQSVWRTDQVRPSLERDQVLANAPLTEDGFIRVRAVLD